MKSRIRALASGATLAIAVASVFVGRAVAASAPTMVADINPSGSSAPEELTNVGGELYFSAFDAARGRELWKSNGSAAGTKLVKDIRPGSKNSFPTELTDVGGMLFFSAGDKAHGRELWMSDGTEGGTTLVKNIRPGSGSSNPLELTNVAGTLYFTAADNKGRELWRSDGTPVGTVRVKNIMSGSVGSVPEELTAAEDRLFFTADDGTGRQLFISDGTALGTHNDLPGGVDARGLTHVSPGRTIDFFSSDFGHFVYRYDDSTQGSTELTEINEIDDAFNLRTVAGELFFFAHIGPDASLWHSDGTSAGTELIETLPDPYTSLHRGAPVAAGSKLLFGISDGTNPLAIWVSDGTSTGTKQVGGTSPSQSYPEEMTAFGNRIFFNAVPVCGTSCSGDYELWRSNGTAAGTFPVADIVPGSAGSDPRWLTKAGGTLFFSAAGPSGGRELWKYVP